MVTAREAADALGEAYDAHDVQRFVAGMRPDVVFVVPDAGELKGREQVAAYVQGFFDAFPDAELEPVAKYEDGNTTIDEWIFRGTHTGPLALPDGETVPPTMKRVSVPGLDIETWDDDGVLIGDRAYFDQLDFLTQLGLVPPA